MEIITEITRIQNLKSYQLLFGLTILDHLEGLKESFINEQYCPLWGEEQETALAAIDAAIAKEES